MEASTASPKSETVVLVHGTFAGRASDEGKNWWQLGSAATTELKRRLPAEVTLPPHGRVFHWSGENSERARIKAATELLTHLRKLDHEGKGFHLVGHSHGGSVIWHALRLGVLQGKPLKHLRSWATLGTPFLHVRPKVGGNLMNWLNVVLAIILAKPAILTFTRLVGLFISPDTSYWLGGNVEIQAHKITFWDTPVLWLLQGLGERVEFTEHGLKVGSYDPGSGQSATEFLLFTPEGWLMLAVALVVIYVFLNLASFFLSPVFEALRLKAEQRLEKQTFSVYGKRWLGIWSPDDEAINGLRATLDMTVSFVARMIPREPVLLSDYISLLSRPYYWIFAPVFNVGLRPMLDGFVRSFVVKRAQGNNRPAAEVVRVSASPLSGGQDHLFPPIPPTLNGRIVDRANERASGVAAELRRLLAAPSFVSGLEQLGQKLSGGELVHTSYFDHAEVMDLLAMHIAWAHGSTDWTSYSVTGDPELVEWLRACKRGLGAELAVEPPESASAEVIRPHRIKPRRTDARHVA